MTDETFKNIHKDAIQWACKLLKSHGYTLKSDLPEKVKHTHWSFVTRFQTSEGYFYLKQTPPAIALEVKISKILQNKFAAPTPTIIDSNDKLNCFLMKDAGISLREVLKKKFDNQLICRAIKQFSFLQIAVSNNVNDLINIGVPDWRLEKFTSLYIELISNKKLLIEDGLSEIEIAKLETMIPNISLLCKKLSSFPIKQTIAQPDCNDNNMLIDKKSNTITIIDLGEIVISHPFFSLVNFLHILKKHHSLKDEDETFIDIKSAGLSPYFYFESKENIETAFSIAQALWFIYEILALYRLMLACGKETTISWQHGKLSCLFRGLIKYLLEFN